MRLLIYAMESSGASAFCCFLGQRPDSIAIVDVWSRALTPPIWSEHPTVAKATVNMTRTLADHQKSFRPDHTILFVRDPVAVWKSLTTYPYANTFGRIEEKFSRFEAEFSSNNYGTLLMYEDFVARDDRLFQLLNDLGWPVNENYFEMTRSQKEICEYNCANSPWLRENYGKGWGFGNIKDVKIARDFIVKQTTPDIENIISVISPHLYAHYTHYWIEKKEMFG